MRGPVRSLLVAGLVLPAAAFTIGGWAVTTVEDLPEYVVAGKPFDLTWSVRQHGQGILTGLRGSVATTTAANRSDAGATSLGEGMYRARVTIAEPGTWDVRVNTGFMNAGVTIPLKVIAASAPAPAPMTPYERGQNLYVAKGCASCHTHQLTKGYNIVEAGPDLSEPKFASAYLTRFLTNPSIKTDWKRDRMPNLGLKPAEVAALTAFLNPR